MFHKVGRDGSAKCDAWQTGNVCDQVQGVIFAVSQEQMNMLDDVEGEGRGYRRRKVVVADDHGYRQQVLIYCATDINTELMPFDWYRLHVLQGAREHRLSADYICAIAAVPVQSDPDESRRRYETCIYGEAWK